jgi:hypothetical protein
MERLVPRMISVLETAPDKMAVHESTASG